MIIGLNLNKKNSFSDGTYIAQQSLPSYVTFFSENKEFIFMHTGWSSYLPHGKFECKEGKVFATDNKDVYVFSIIDDETLSFLQGESSETPLKNGTIFKLNANSSS